VGELDVADVVALGPPAEEPLGEHGERALPAGPDGDGLGDGERFRLGGHRSFSSVSIFSASVFSTSSAKAASASSPPLGGRGARGAGRPRAGRSGAPAGGPRRVGSPAPPP